MIINKINISPYNIRLKRPLSNSQNIYSDQSGYIITLIIDQYVGYGEVSLLKGFSKDGFKQVIWAFEEIKMSLIEDEEYHQNELFNIFEIAANKNPSLHFALDTALFDILSQMSSVSIARYLNPSSLDSIKMSSMHLEGFESKNDCIKIKLQCSDVREDSLKLKNIIAGYDDGTVFRIDANKGYDLNDAIHICSLLSQFNVEYIEEPLKNMSINQLEILKNKTRLKIAIDESIYNQDCKKLIKSKLIDFAIIKPSIYGSFSKIFKFKKYLESNNIKIVISSALENYIGNMSVINIAAALDLPTSHGINNQLFFDYGSNVAYNEYSLSFNVKDIIGLGVTWNDS